MNYICVVSNTGGVTHHSPTQVLKNFDEIKFLKIELPSGELGIEDDVLLKWRADFRSTLDKCVILGASSVIHPQIVASGNVMNNGGDDNGSIPESFYTNGGLKLRVVMWVLCMNKEQLEELRVKPLLASSASKRTLRTLVPALNMKLSYASYLELPNGSVLKGATLVAIRPSEQAGQKDVSDRSWVSSAFEEPYGTAASLKLIALR
ncbi:putative F-box protein AUF1 [Helianthus annuus]|nr:putative F-box protein AUF1 [Helianthus annuus]